MTTITCSEFVDCVTDFVEGGLDENVRICVETHIQYCSHCGRFLASYQATLIVVRALPRGGTQAPGGP